jgi:hypothetical protein
MNKYQGYATRFAWAVLASILLHLAFFGNLLDLQWGQLFSQFIVPAPLQVHLSRLAAIVPPSPPPEFPRPRSNKPPQKKPAAVSPPLPPISQASTTVSIDRPASDIPQFHADAQLDKSEPESSAPPSVDQSMSLSKLQLPPNGQLIYKFYWGEARWMAGQAVHQWVIENGHYTLSSVVSTSGLFQLIHPTRLTESSSGFIADGRLRPMQFSTQWNDDPPAVAIFDWNSNLMRWTRGNEAFDQALPNNSYDKISYLYQLYLTPINDKNLSVHITMGRMLEPYAIRNMGVEEIEIDERVYPAIHLKREESPSHEENIDIWLSTTLSNLPLKLIYSNIYGDHFEQLISSDTLEEMGRKARR